MKALAFFGIDYPIEDYQAVFRSMLAEYKKCLQSILALLKDMD
jgi:hypothetical protein